MKVMKWLTWVRSLLLSVALVLIQSPIVKHNEDGSFMVDQNYVVTHTIYKVGQYLTAMLINGAVFIKLQMLLFKRIFYDYDIANTANFSLLIDLFTYGMEMSDNFWSIIYTFS